MGSIYLRRASNKLSYQIMMYKVGAKLFLIILLISLIIVGYTYSFVLKPLLTDLGSAKASQIGQMVINHSVEEVLAKDEHLKNNLITVEKTQDGRISGVISNMAIMNKLKSEIAITIAQKLSENTNSKIYVPLGNVSGLNLLSNFGPKIVFNLIPYGTTHVDFKTTFVQAGINQTRHQVDVSVTLTVALLLANRQTASSKITTTIPVSETIIVGEVPGSYTNLETKDSTVREDLLNLLDN